MIKSEQLRENLKRPKIHILLATFNRAHLIGETLDSIISQTYTNWECIIVDDFSSDSTKLVIDDYLRKDQRFHYFPKTEKYGKGLSGSRNYGLDLAEKSGAELVQLFDDDDIMHPKKLELQIAPFLSDNSLDLTLCRYNRFVPGEDLKEVEGNSEVNIESANLADDFLFNKVQINSPGPLFKARLFEEERFDEELAYGEEREMFLRIFFKHRPRYLAINKVLFFYRYHLSSITLKETNMQEKLGANILVVQKLWKYLYENKLLNNKTVAFFLRQFLLENHNKEFVQSVYDFTLEDNQIGRFNNIKFRLLIKFHSFYIKAFYKLLLMK